MKWKKLKSGCEEIYVMKKTMLVFLFLNETNWEAWVEDKSGSTSKLIAKGKSKEKVREKAEVWLYKCAEEILKDVWE